MKAVAVYPSQHILKVVQDQPEPHITQPSHVKLRMLEIGICGTDKEIARFDYGTPPAGQERLIIGHESLAEVVEVGQGVEHIKPGDLVVPTVRRPCGQPKCPACAIGRQDYCYTGLYTERGIKEHDGYMTEFVVEEEQYLHHVPRDLRDIAVLTEPLTISQKALRQIFDVQDRLPWSCSIGLSDPERQSKDSRPNISCRRAMVLGAGPVGLLATMTLLNAGFDTTIYSRTSGSTDRVDIVNKLGGKFVVAEEVSPDQLPQVVGDVDVVLEAVGASKLAFQVLNMLGPNAIFVFTGVPGRRGKNDEDTDFIMRNLVLNNQALIGTVNAGPEAFISAIDSLGAFEKRWPGQLARLITGRIKPEETPDLLTSDSDHGIKNVVVFSD